MAEYFQDEEFACKCCGVVKIDAEFRKKLNAARLMAEVPFLITSGYRCPKHNKEVGSTSLNHVSGKAVDLSCHTANHRFRMIEALLFAGMTGIGIGPKYIHCDIFHDIKTMWLYND